LTHKRRPLGFLAHRKVGAPEICWALGGRFDATGTNLTCKVCISKITRAYKRINVPKQNIVTFPEVDVDIDSVCDMEKIKTVDDLKRLTYKDWDLGLAVASSLISSVRDHEPDLNYYKDFIERGIKTATFVYESGDKLLDEIRPDIVYLFNGRFLEVRPFMRLCEKKSIKFYTHERGGVLKNYLLREEGIPHSLMLATNEIRDIWENGGKDKEEIGRKFFEDRRNRVIQGWHSFTRVRRRQFDDGRRRIFSRLRAKLH